MRRRARPRVIAGMGHKSRSHRVSLHVANRRPKMFVVPRAGKESPLKDMAAAAVKPVEFLAIPRVSLAKRFSKRLFALRRDDPMDVVVHQTISQRPHAVAPHVTFDQMQVRAALV